MDSTDREILAILQDEGRITFTELAARVQLSISRCQRRVRDLETQGVVTGYHAAVDAARLGLGFEVIVFATLTRPESVTEFDHAVVDVPQVVEALRLFGDPDYMIRVVAPDLARYQRLYDDVLSRLPGVQRLSSTIVMKQTVARRPLPQP